MILNLYESALIPCRAKQMKNKLELVSEWGFHLNQILLQGNTSLL